MADTWTFDTVKLTYNGNWGSDATSQKRKAYLLYLLRTKYNNQYTAATTTDTTTKQIYGGGTAINVKAPTVVCDKGADGNMYCHPK